jgi:hypothetical protein
MFNTQGMKNIQENSFYDMLLHHYRMSRFVLPDKKPSNDLLSMQEIQELHELIEENDHYEIHHLIRGRYN